MENILINARCIYKFNISSKLYTGINYVWHLIFFVLLKHSYMIDAYVTYKQKL